MPPSTNPLSALTPALGALGRGPGLPEGLTGEPGIALVEWLLDDGVTAAHLADADASVRSYAQGAGSVSTAELRNDLTTICYMRQYQAMPHLMMFLQDAIAHLETSRQAIALADYLQWLARRAALIG